MKSRLTNRKWQTAGLLLVLLTMTAGLAWARSAASSLPRERLLATAVIAAPCWAGRRSAAAFSHKVARAGYRPSRAMRWASDRRKVHNSDRSALRILPIQKRRRSE